MSFSTFRARLIVVIVLAALPAFGLTGYAYLSARRIAAATVHRDAQQLAQLAAALHEEVIRGAQQLLVGLSEAPDVHGRDEQQCQALFGALLKRYPHYLNLLAVTTKGEVFCSAVPLAGPQSVADRDWFQRALQTRSFVVSEYEVDGITQRGTLAFALPLLGSAGLLSGVAAGMLDPVYLSGLAVGASLPPQTELTVIDRSGTLVARYPEHEKWVGRRMPEAPLVTAILSGRQGFVEAPGLDGIRRSYAVHPIASLWTTGLFFSLGLSAQERLAPVNRAFVWSLTTLALITALMCAAAWVASGSSMFQWMRPLVDSGPRVTERGPKGRSEVAAPNEREQLRRAADEMARTAESRRTEAERARQALRASEERFRLLAEGVKDSALVLLDAAGHVLSRNAGAERPHGYSAEEAIGHPYSAFFVPEDLGQGLPEQLLKTAAAEGRVEGERWQAHKDGSRVPIRFALTALRDVAGQLRGFAEVTRDVTELQRAAETRRKTEEIEADSRRLTAQDRLKTELALDLSDELGASLSAIVDSAKHLQNGAASPAPGDQQQVLNEILTDAAPQNPSVARVPSILVVEDHPDHGTWLGQTLSDAGYRAEVASTGAEALTKGGGEAFDAILLDLFLPDMSGRDLLRELRARGAHRPAPVVLVNVVVEPGVALAVQVNDLVVKPVPPEELLAALRRARVLPGRAQSLMIVDPDPAALSLAERMLRVYGYHPVCFSDTRSAFAAVANDPPAGIILDLSTLAADGFEFFQEFRRRSDRRTAVILSMVKDVAAVERERLASFVRSIAPETGGGATLLEELRTCVPPAQPPVTRVEGPASA